MENTAIQEAIEKLKEERNKVHNLYLISDDVQEMEELSYQLTGLDFAIKTNKELLPKEREQIETAFYDGGDMNCPNGEIGTLKSMEYFTTKYKQDDSKNT